MRVIRPLLWLIGGLVLGGIIHIIVILTLPALAEQSVWSRVADLEADNRMVILPPVLAGELNPLMGSPYPLERAGEAIKELGERRALGKVTLQIR